MPLSAESNADSCQVQSDITASRRGRQQFVWFHTARWNQLWAEYLSAACCDAHSLGFRGWQVSLLSIRTALYLLVPINLSLFSSVVTHWLRGWTYHLGKAAFNWQIYLYEFLTAAWRASSQNCFSVPEKFCYTDRQIQVSRWESE